MRKLSLLLGTMGGVLAGYLLTNDKLRKELMAAKTPEKAAKMLGKHLQEDGTKLAKEVKVFVQSEEVQKNLGKAKKFTMAKLDEAKAGMKVLVKQGKKEASKAMKEMMK